MFEVSALDPFCLAKALADFDPEEERRQKIKMDSCPMVEYEHDMGATIPFCKMDNEPCNMQCER